MPLAISSAWPATPSGTDPAAIASGSSGALARPGNFVQIGVAMIPGCTEFTRIPSLACAHSSAIDFANSRTAPFDALYPARPAEPRNPAIDDNMTIEPPLPARRIAGMQYLHARNTPST